MNETVKDLVVEEVESEAVEAVIEEAPKMGFWGKTLIGLGIVTGVILVVKGTKLIIKKVKSKKAAEEEPQVAEQTEEQIEGK